MIAACNNSDEVCRILILAAANVHARNDFGRTALMRAVDGASEEACRLLIAAGSDVNATWAINVTHCFIYC